MLFVSSHLKVDEDHVHSQSVLPPFKSGTPAPARLDIKPRYTRSSSPTLDFDDAACPATSETSTSMNRRIMSLVTWGTSNPTMCEEADTYNQSRLKRTTYPCKCHISVFLPCPHLSVIQEPSLRHRGLSSAQSTQNEVHKRTLLKPIAPPQLRFAILLSIPL